MSPTRHTAPILAVLLFAGAASGQVVDPGDILVASTTATEGQIEKVDPLTGETEGVVAYGGVGTRIQDIAVAGDGTIDPAGARSIVSLDPLSGQVTSDLLRQPYDLAVSHTGRLFVADINVEPGNPV